MSRRQPTETGRRPGKCSGISSGLADLVGVLAPERLLVLVLELPTVAVFVGVFFVVVVVVVVLDLIFIILVFYVVGLVVILLFIG